MTRAKKLGITKFPHREYDENMNQIYFEDKHGNWVKYIWDERGNKLYYENNGGGWDKHVYDDLDRQIRIDSSNGSWISIKFGVDNELIFYEDHYGNFWTKKMSDECPFKKIRPFNFD